LHFRKVQNDTNGYQIVQSHQSANFTFTSNSYLQQKLYNQQAAYMDMFHEIPSFEMWGTKKVCHVPINAAEKS